jgi:regulator of RNase E activity RraA
MPPTDALAALRDISTATLTGVLAAKGLRNVWVRGARPAQAGLGRVVGPAFTLRFVPARDDLVAAAGASGITTRTAIEAMPAGAVVVAATGGVTDAGILGDILCRRMALRAVAGVVTDGAIRDAEGVAATGLPVWCGGVAAPPPNAVLHFAGWQDTIGCGGVAIVPGDVMVMDADGAVVIPRALLDEVVAAARAQDAADAWIMGEIERGTPLPGLYPMNAETRARYEAARRG